MPKTKREPKIPVEKIKIFPTIDTDKFREHIVSRVFKSQKENWQDLQRIKKAIANKDFTEAEKLFIHSAKFKAYILSEKILQLSQILM